MTKETMTVHQALCEMKVLGKRINAAIRAVKPISTKEQNAQKVDGITLDEFKSLAKSSHDSAVDLIKRQIALKAAVNQYNAEKHITVAGKDYTVAQAIWLMSYGMEEQRSLMDRYTAMLQKASDEIERRNGDELNRKAEAAMTAIYGNKDKANGEAFNQDVETYKKNHAVVMVDPLGIRDIISKMEKEISAFESGVDAAIQVANATTQITIEY